jgi:hypothetical protein
MTGAVFGKKNTDYGKSSCDKWVPVTMAWHVLRLRLEEWPPDVDGGCEYIE